MASTNNNTNNNELSTPSSAIVPTQMDESGYMCSSVILAMGDDEDESCHKAAEDANHNHWCNNFIVLTS
jgi:hypothetical protein